MYQPVNQSNIYPQVVGPYQVPVFQTVHEANVIVQNQAAQITLLENKIRGITGDINTVTANIQIRNQEVEDIQNDYNNAQQILNQNMFRVRELESTVDHLKEEYQQVLLDCDQKENDLFQMNQDFINKTRDMKQFRTQSDQYDNVQGFILDLQNKLRQQELEYNRLRGNVYPSSQSSQQNSVQRQQTGSGSKQGSVARN